jgi:hypothetical protein
MSALPKKYTHQKIQGAPPYMKSFVVGMVVGSAVSCAVAFASSTVNHNEMFWNQLNRAAKDGYVNGYADAMRVSVSKLDTLTTAGDLVC